MAQETPIDAPLVRDLTQAENLPGSPSGVEFRFTHGSFVFLTEDAVYKIKRPRDYGFFDYSTLSNRRHYCHEEVRLNRRSAPDVYLGVLPVYLAAGVHTLNGPGEIVDWAVHMQRLPDARSALALLQQGAVGEREIAAIARTAADFYRGCAESPPDPEGLQTSIEENFEQLAPFAGSLLHRETLTEVEHRQREWLVHHRELLRQRRCRDGHGDLRLEHVYLLPRGVVFIDCIEFLDRFRICDPALDAAFFAMDLNRINRPDLAESFLARFARECDDFDPFRLADGYMSYRATVRCKVACFVAADGATPKHVQQRKRNEAEQHLALARLLLAREPSDAGSDDAGLSIYRAHHLRE